MARYIVRPGDTINSIAERAGLTREQFIALNPGIDQRWEIELAAQEGWAVRLGSGNSIGPGAGTAVALAYEERPNYSRSDLSTQTSQSPILTWGRGANTSSGAIPTTPGRMPGESLEAFADRRQRTADAAARDAARQETLRTERATSAGVPPTPLTDVSAPAGDAPLDPLNPAGGGGGGGVDPGPTVDAAAIRASIEMTFPWVTAMGLGDSIIAWITQEGLETPAEIISRIRNPEYNPAYATMFANIRREDGTMRMNESQYLATMDQYRSLLNQFGFIGDSYSNQDLSNFLARDVDANELGQRLQTWDQIMRGGADLRAAFYVYGGIPMSDDDLYYYVVDPARRASFDEQYASNSQGLDYATYIGRVADWEAQATGGDIDRETSVALLDQLSHGGDPINGDHLSLSELRNAYEIALLGSTALAQGLVLPSLDRVEEFRMAGISRTAALQQYGEYARDQNFLNAISKRAGGGGFTQAEFEDASFLYDPEASRELERAESMEAARANPSRSFAFNQDPRSNRVAQGGFSAFRN